MAKILSLSNALTYLNSTTGGRFGVSVFALCGSITPSTVRRKAAMETVPLFDSEYLANQAIDDVVIVTPDTHRFATNK